MQENNTITAKILAHAGYSGFPKNYVWRDHLVKTIDDLFSPDIDVIHLEGRTGIGISSLAAEYAHHSKFCVIAIFIRVGSRLSYAPFRLAEDLLTQADIYLGHESGKLLSGISNSWQVRLMQLRDQQRRMGRSILFIVDGLHQIPAEDTHHITEIYKEILAIGVPGIKHLITVGEKTTLTPYIDSGRSRPYRATRLSSIEASGIFASCQIPDREFKNYHSYTDGIPALIQSACRLYSQGKGLDGLTSELSSFYSAEWQEFLSLTTLPTKGILDAFGFLIFGKGALDLDEICDICVLKRENILSLCDKDIFIKRKDDKVGVEFLSHSHREFVASKLAHQRPAVVNLMIERLGSDPQSNTSLALLPSFYEETGQFDNLVNYLSPENLGRYLDYSRSATALRRRTELGMRRAIEGAKHVETYRFALQTSLIRSMDTPRLSPEQMGALAGLGEIDQAFAHSQLARTDEERLHLLSILVRELHRSALLIPTSVEQQVRELISGSDLTPDKEWGVEVATNLVGAFPDLALLLIEKVEPDSAKARESAINTVALNEIVRAKVEDQAPTPFVSKLKSSEDQVFFTALRSTLLTKSVDDLDISTRNVSPKMRGLLLRQWASANKTTKDSYRIIEIALADFLKDASYLPSASDLWELCATLVSCENPVKLDELSKKIEGFKGSLSQIGSTIDLVGLELELAIAQSLALSIASSGRFEEIYINVADLSDRALRVEGFAMILLALRRVKAKVHLSDSHIVAEAIDKELPPLIDVLLSQTADHALVFEQSLSVFLELDPTYAIGLVSRFNTEDRRDDGFATLANAYVRQRRRDADLDLLDKMVSSVVGRDVREQVYVSVLTVLRASKKAIDSKLSNFLSKIPDIRNPILRCNALTQAIALDFSPGNKVDEYLKDIQGALRQIDRSPSRPREGYKFVQMIIELDKNEGLRAYLEIEKELNTYQITSESALSTTYLCARAAVMSFASLLEKNASSDDHLARLILAIETVPSLSMRMNLFADLALRAYEKKAKNIFDIVCAKQIYPIIANSNLSNHYSHEKLVGESFVCIYLWNQLLALELLNQCASEAQELALAAALEFIITGIPENEPVKNEKLAFSSIDYPRSIQVLSLLSLLRTDSLIAENIEKFCRVLNNKSSRNQVSRPQRMHFAENLLTLIDKKLPDSKNITHQGWAILSKAFVGIISDSNDSSWNAYCEAAKSIPNASDKVFVLGTLLTIIPERLNGLRSATLNFARDALTQIPSDADAMMRRISLSDGAAGFEKAAAERLLREAVKNSLKLKDSETALYTQKRIIDTAHKFDKGLAEKLIDLIDDDPARHRAKIELRQDAKSLKKKEAVIDGKYDAIAGEKSSTINRICFDLLAGLNNGKLNPPRLEDLIPLLRRASTFAVREIYWAYAWILRSCQQRLQATADTHRVLLPIFEVTLLSCELAQRMTDGNKSTLTWSDKSISNGVVVGSINRLDAESFLGDWFEKTKEDSVLICDPYFTLQDLNLVKAFYFKRPTAKFTILSCKSNSTHNVRDVMNNLEAAWNSVCDQTPPEIRLIVVLYDGEGIGGPIHDRWIFCGNEGLRVGTSLNSLGLSKLSEISSVENAQVPNIVSKLNRFVLQQDRAVDGRRLRYFSEML